MQTIQYIISRREKRLFVFAYDATDDNEAGIKKIEKYFLPKAKIENFNVLNDGRNFYDQPINDLKKQYDERINRTGR